MMTPDAFMLYFANALIYLSFGLHIGVFAYCSFFMKWE